MILTAYFNTVKDPQRKVFWKGNDFNIIKALYESVKELSEDMIIFHDHLSDKFMSEHSTEKIRFEYYKPLGDVLNARLMCYREHLIDNSYDKILCLDIDTELLKAPFELFVKDAILIGSENAIIGESGYIGKFYKRAYGEVKYPEKRLLNCGILGGYYDLLLELLDDYYLELKIVKGKRCIDMAVMNTIIYRKYNFITGYPIHTKFSKNEKDTDCFIKHK